MRPVRPAARRRRWLAEREARGLARPNPVVLAAVNAASVSYRARRARGVWSLTLTIDTPLGPVDVALACEMADVPADTPGWDTYQRGPLGSPESALAIAVRETRGRIDEARLLHGTAAVRDRRGGWIRRRPILHAKVRLDPGTIHAWSRTVNDGHPPPARAPWARRRYLDRFEDAPGSIDVGDWNIGRRWAMRLFGGKRVYSAGVMHIAVPRWIPSTATTVDVGSDHPALVVRLW